MASTIQAKDLSLDDLFEQFRLEQTEEEAFFREWQDELPSLSEPESIWLERVRLNYRELTASRFISENAVKMVVLSPLLDMAGFYRHPFRLETEVETSLAIEAEDEGVLYKGRIDVLLLWKKLWVLIIESKSARFNVTLALPQTLFYMLSGPEPVAFALISNGEDFLFAKLTKQPVPRYALSRKFTLVSPSSQELGEVLRILKRCNYLFRQQ
ncbi:hypothetical protein [Gloeobacter violaceus]|uniref:Gll2972 protein n=1 Tax=Gloeobacter violaceus (strain ATCC 29082 / PCC 7421) TaxID=251221 RepID=Q7NCK6_GLOVI|nr:hypothetical protein [Gloeobacter violaceus]BAC90913.1 gll2972 [Gloeobacter violaceus PCC 7421]